MKRFYTIDNGRVVPAEDGEGTITVLINPDDHEKQHMVEGLQIDEHTLACALDPDELSRLEYEPDHAAIIFKRPKNYSAEDRFLFKIYSVGVFLFKERMIIVQTEDIPLFEGKEFTRVNSLLSVMLRLVYRSIIHFREHLKVISMISDELQTKISRSLENRYLLNMFALEKSLEFYLNAINSNGLLLEKLKLSTNRLALTTEQTELLDDILVENTQCGKQAEIYSNVLASLMDARASIVSNNLNVLMKTLNIITILIMVPTFVVSAFSMNVRIPLADRHHAFWIIMGLAVLSVTGVIWLWRRLKW